MEQLILGFCVGLIGAFLFEEGFINWRWWVFLLSAWAMYIIGKYSLIQF